MPNVVKIHLAVLKIFDEKKYKEERNRPLSLESAPEGQKSATERYVKSYK
jgi:hypothetical protein